MIESGIYQILNLINNKRYIGQTINFDNRKRQHFSLLKRNQCHNLHLQKSYNKYGKEIFVLKY